MGLFEVADWTAGSALMLSLHPEKPTLIVACLDSAYSLGFSLGNQIRFLIKLLQIKIFQGPHLVHFFTLWVVLAYRLLHWDL